MRSVLAALCLFATTAHAVPAQFTHQGRLLDADGVPLEGDATITFRVITEETGGEVLWQEPITVDLNAGFYAAVLGTDEETNPLDTEVLSQAPVWLELQIDGELAMFPRSAINAVPYATMATVAEEVAGGPVDASQIAVDGTPVVNELGEWVGPAPSINWSDIEGMPDDFADGIDDDTDTDTDSFAVLGTSCLDGDVPVWDAVLMEWICGTDATLTADEVDAIVADNGYAMATDLFSGSFTDLTGVPDGLSDGDDNTQLTADEVDAIVADNGYAMATDLFSGNFDDLTGIPESLADGDDTLSEETVDGMVADNGFALATDVFSGLFDDLAGIPASIADGDDDALRDLECIAGQTLVQTDEGWACTELISLLDADSDGTLVWADCDDTDASSTVRANDADCDGILTEDDSDDDDADAGAWTWTQYTVGSGHTCGVTNGGDTLCWGKNDYGQTSPPETPLTAIDAGDNHTCGLNADGQAECWGDNSYGNTSPPSTVFASLSSGLHHSCGLTAEGTAQCWGNTDDLRTSPPSIEFSEISVGSHHACGISGDTIRCWGRNDYGEASPPDARPYTSVSAGMEFSCGLHTDGDIECWGRGEGRGTPPSRSDFVSVTSGGYHSCGLTSDGTVECWACTRCADSVTENIPDGTFTSIKSGYDHVCAQSTDGELHCWGENSWGKATPPEL